MGECHLHKFAGHTEKRCHPHPEQGGGASQVQGQGHTADVTGANGTGQRRGQGLEMGGVSRRTFLVKLSHGDSNCMLEISYLGKSEVDRKKDTDCKQQGGKPDCTAQITVHENQEVINCVQCDTPFDLCYVLVAMLSD